MHIKGKRGSGFFIFYTRIVYLYIYPPPRALHILLCIIIFKIYYTMRAGETRASDDDPRRVN